MSDKPFKRFEREIGVLLGGRRHWSNSGEKIDVTSDRFVAQCKLVSRLSLEELTGLVELIDFQASASDPSEPYTPNRLGLVCVKLRRGKGKPSPTLVVMTSDTFRQLIGYTRDQP